MSAQTAVIDIRHLERRFGPAEAVRDLNIEVQPGRCYGFFGRNGAGKTTTIKCLLNLLKPGGGLVRVFGMDPRTHEVEIKRRLAYVPDQVAFYPWMSVRDVLGYFASFRQRWNLDIQNRLLDTFGLDPGQNVSGLSKGQKTQLALITAMAPEPELLILDEPTSGLDPIVRREVIQSVIGAYQEPDPEHRTVFVSTHLISEFEGLIDEFTIIENGRDILTLDADSAREKFKKIRARFEAKPPALKTSGILSSRVDGQTLEVICNGSSEQALRELQSHTPLRMETEGLSLEEIFMVSARRKETVEVGK